MRLALALVAATSVVISEGHWSPATPLPEPIQELSAAALHGKIYIAGGFDRSGKPIAKAFRFDPAAARWERIGDLPAPRHHMPLAVAGDTLYAVGGLAEATFVPENTLWIYREDVNRWEPRAPLPSARGASGVGVVNGKLVLVGGWGSGRKLVDSSAIYDPATNRWSTVAPIPTPRDHLTAAAVGGIVYAIGGRPFNPDHNYDLVEAYDPATNRWTKKSPMPSRRGGLAAAVLDGKIHAFGGETRSSVFDNHEVYDPATDRWTTAPPLPTARHGLGAATVSGTIYVIGGGPKAGFAQTDVVEMFVP
jgi:N-acetylneuraminic acid mutarotase